MAAKCLEPRTLLGYEVGVSTLRPSGGFELCPLS